jgi:glutathione synthase
VESVGRNSYVIAQEYLPEAEDGDTRLFLVNGKPLVVDGKYAAVRRMAGDGRFPEQHERGRAAGAAGGGRRHARLAAIVGPKLIKDGIFFAGLDIVGDKLVEINTISSGGLNIAGKLQEVTSAPR